MKKIEVEITRFSEAEFSEMRNALENGNFPTETKSKMQQILDTYKALQQEVEKFEAKKKEVLDPLIEKGIDPSDIKSETSDDESSADDLPPNPEDTLEPLEPEEPESNPDNSGKNNPESPTNANKGRGGKKPLHKGKIHHHKLQEVEKICSSCGQKMAMARSQTKTFVLVAAFLQTRTDVAEICHCEKCSVTHKATLPDVTNQTIGRYHHSAVAHMTALRYQYGMASYRLEDYLKTTGLRVSDSTQWALFENAASQLKPFHSFLSKMVANSNRCHMDDTYQKIISLSQHIESEQENAKRSGKNPDSIRSGIHTTNVTAVYDEGSIVLFDSGLHHAGEIIAKLLEKRSIEEQLILMTDASSSNMSQIKDAKNVAQAKCNSHAVRKFKDLAKSEQKIADEMKKQDHKTSEKIDFFLRNYRRVFKNDKDTKSMSPEARMQYHKTHSLPLMESMKQRMEDNLRKKIVEPSSDLGKIYNYFKKHYQELCAFCHIPDAPIGRVKMWRGDCSIYSPVSTSCSSNRTCAANASGFRPKEFTFSRSPFRPWFWAA